MVNEVSYYRAQSSDGPGAEVYTDMLQKNMTPYITTQVFEVQNHLMQYKNHNI